MKFKLNRREWIGATAAVLAAAGAGQVLGADEAPAADAKPPGEWFDRPMRWVQLVLAENDPGTYDAKFWLDYFKRVHADAACLSAGGCVAYYPTKIEHHHRSAWMKEGTDPFGELVEGCRKLGMVVVARTDPHSIRDDAAQAHPEWVAVDAQGRKRRHWAAPNRWVTCALGPYNFEFMTEVTREIVRLYGVDGIFANRWQGHGVCYCDSCKTRFTKRFGHDLPRTTDPAETAYRNWIEWSSERLFELWRLWDGEIRKMNPGARYIANSGGGSMTTLDMRTIAQIAPTLFADRQSRRGLMAPWANGKNGKEFRATFGRKPIVGIASIGIDDEHRWKDSVNTEAELRIWLADGIANGLRPWVAKFSGAIHDPRWLPVVEKVYDWHWRNEKYLRNEENLARVAMVYSQQTGTYYGGVQKHRRVEDHELGMYQALVEARVPFEMAHDRLLDPEHVGRYKLLILPNVAAMSDAQCEQIRSFVKSGGSVLATFETSLYDEQGRQRRDFGLADLFGVSYDGTVARDVKNAYMRIEAQTKHPILKGLENAGRIINTVQRVAVKPMATFADPPLTQVPSYPDLPMEEVYPRVPRTTTPEVYLREVGAGRVAYFPGDVDRTFWEVLALDHGTLLGNVVEWALNEPRPVEVTGQGVLDVTVWRQKESMSVHLVNLTNPMMMKGPFRELIPLGAQTVRVRLPKDRQPRGVRLLVGGGTPKVAADGGTLTLGVPSILDHEVVAIDL
ncbi:MAG TPA: beta-galactosidase trimerization domain-containing protein [Tepidisphaeraceae bacterium]